MPQDNGPKSLLQEAVEASSKLIVNCRLALLVLLTLDLYGIMEISSAKEEHFNHAKYPNKRN